MTSHHAASKRSCDHLDLSFVFTSTSAVVSPRRRFCVIMIATIVMNFRFATCIRQKDGIVDESRVNSRNLQWLPVPEWSIFIIRTLCDAILIVCVTLAKRSWRRISFFFLSFFHIADAPRPHDKVVIFKMWPEFPLIGQQAFLTCLFSSPFCWIDRSHPAVVFRLLLQGGDPVAYYVRGFPVLVLR